MPSDFGIRIPTRAIRLTTNSVQVDEEERAMSYTQIFQLLPEGGSYYVFNDMFRLVYVA